MPIHNWFILIDLGRYHEQKPSLINHDIFSLNAAELSTLMHVWGTDKLFSAAIFISLNWLDNVYFGQRNSYKLL